MARVSVEPIGRTEHGEEAEDEGEAEEIQQGETRRSRAHEEGDEEGQAGQEDCCEEARDQAGAEARSDGSAAASCGVADLRRYSVASSPFYRELRNSLSQPICMCHPLWRGAPGEEGAMPSSGRPFLFCRYAITVGGEQLNKTAQFKLISEMQGRLVAHTERAAEEKNFDTLIMRPKRLQVDKHEIFFWSVGVTIQKRLRAKYDRANDRIDLELINDGSVRFNDFIAAPSLSVLAVDDRGGELHLGGKGAINRFMSVIDNHEDAEASVVFEATPEEVRRALKDWSLTRFKFTLQPNNPRPVSRLAQALSEQFKKDGIGKLTGTAVPAEGSHMHMDDEGFIAAATGLVEAGYGQVAVAGHTKDGLDAEIKKPRFDSDVLKNEKIQEKPRELRVFVDDEDMNEDEVARTAARALIKFHE